jgi:hypothetical protein
MGAVLISRNDLSRLDPDAATGIERAVARAVATSAGAFRVSIERVMGSAEMLVRIEEHRPGGGSWRGEVRLASGAPPAKLEEHIADLMRR